MADDLRPALVATQHIAVAEDDAARIREGGKFTETALRAAIDGSLFDTEPAHFDRFLNGAAGKGKS